MSDESNQFMENKMNEELDRIFNGQTTITKEKMKQALEEFRNGRGGGRGGRGRGGMGRIGPIQDEMKRKMSEILQTELNKISSNTITKEQAKSAILSFGSQAKDQCHTQKDQFIESGIKEEFEKLKVSEINASQARDLLRNVNQKMRPSHGMLDDNMKNEFMSEFKNKHGSDKINGDEVWEMLKCFDKKQHDKMGSCERNVDWDKEKDKKWEEMFNEQFKALFGEKKKINQEDIEKLAKQMREKHRQECQQHPGKRVCQH